MKFFKRFFHRPAEEISHERQKEYAVQILRQLLAQKQEQIRQLQTEIDYFNIVAPLVEEHEILQCPTRDTADKGRNLIS